MVCGRIVLHPCLTHLFYFSVSCECLQIIRRSGPEEKVLVLTRRRRGHHCQHAVLIVGVCVWDGIDQSYATELYNYLCHLLPDNGVPTERRCGWNERLDEPLTVLIT